MRNGQLLNRTVHVDKRGSGGSLPVFSTHYFTNLLFLNQWKKGEKTPRKNVPEVRGDLGAACIRSGNATYRATAPGKNQKL